VLFARITACIGSFTSNIERQFKAPAIHKTGPGEAAVGHRALPAVKAHHGGGGGEGPTRGRNSNKPKKAGMQV